MSDRSAVISIGTNSTRYLIADFSAKRYRFFGQPINRVVAQKSVGTRIGEGLRQTGRLGEEPMRRTLQAVAAHREVIGDQAETLYVIATSAVRRAENASEFIGRVRSITGTDVRILSGDDEARCAFRGAVMSVPHGEEQRIGVIDTGGGSTEYAIGDHDHAAAVVSCELGAVRLTERFPELAGIDGKPRKKIMARAWVHAYEKLLPIQDLERVKDLVFVGGSATATVALIRGNRGRFAHMSLARDAMQSVFDELVALPLKKRRKMPGMNPQRADILPAGMIILDTVFRLLGHDHATVATTDLLFGFLLLEHEKTDV